MHPHCAEMPREIDDWVKIQKLQAVAVEEQKKARAVRAKKTQQTIRSHLDGQVEVQERRSMKAKEVKLLEAEKERLEFDQWVTEERQKKSVMFGKITEQKKVRDVQIDARRTKRAEESAKREADEADEMMKIKAEIQRSKEEMIAKKHAEKRRLMKVFEEVDQQKKHKEIQKAKVAEEDRKAARLYAEMLDKQEAARASYFTRKVSDNESMTKKLDEMFGARDRERMRKEKETLERIVREEDQRLKDLEQRKTMQRRIATEERLATLQAQVNEKQMRAARERAEEKRAAMDMQHMAEKATREHESKLAEKQRKMMEYKRSLEEQIKEREAKAHFAMSDVERRLNGPLVAAVRFYVHASHLDVCQHQWSLYSAALAPQGCLCNAC